MPTNIFVNIPTSDLERSKAFFRGLGWRISERFTDENAACVVVDDRIFLMVLTRDFFATFTDKPIVDPHEHLQLEVALSVDSRDDVDALIDRAVAAGGREHRTAQDLGFMYSRDFEDPDGNLFAAVYLEPRAVAEDAGVWGEDAGGHA